MEPNYLVNSKILYVNSKFCIAFSQWQRCFKGKFATVNLEKSRVSIGPFVIHWQPATGATQYAGR